MTGTDAHGGTYHDLPHTFGEPGVLARLLRAIPQCFAPTDVVTFITPFGASFEPAVARACAQDGGRRSREYDIPAGDPALRALAEALAGPARAGAVYVIVSNGDEDLLSCEDGYDWLWLSATLPAAVHARVLELVTGGDERAHGALG